MCSNRGVAKLQLMKVEQRQNYIGVFKSSFLGKTTLVSTAGLIVERI